MFSAQACLVQAGRSLSGYRADRGPIDVVSRTPLSDRDRRFVNKPISEPPFLREAQLAGWLRHHPRSLETRAGYLLRRV